ncbi:hypothetical protein K8I31_21035, partial [bacterium]|nr:hypothetical protein [bacterium]
MVIAQRGYNCHSDPNGATMPEPVKVNQEKIIKSNRMEAIQRGEAVETDVHNAVLKETSVID